jgi:uncharacterized membrane protein
LTERVFGAGSKIMDGKLSIAFFSFTFQLFARMTELVLVVTSAGMCRLDDGVVAVNNTTDAHTVWQMALLSMGSAIVVCATVVGNVLVCVAVAIVRRLRTPSNLLVISLAITDLLVAVFVMPPAAVYEVQLSVCRLLTPLIFFKPRDPQRLLLMTD